MKDSFLPQEAAPSPTWFATLSGAVSKPLSFRTVRLATPVALSAVTLRLTCWRITFPGWTNGLPAP